MLDITVHFGANVLRVFLSLLSIISVLPDLLYLPSVSLPLLYPVCYFCLSLIHHLFLPSFGLFSI